LPRRAYNYMMKTFGSNFNAVFKAMKELGMRTCTDSVVACV
jgi:hypothetical protein